MSIVNRRVRTQQPQDPTSIDWANPLTRGLISLFLPTSMTNLVDNKGVVTYAAGAKTGYRDLTTVAMASGAAGGGITLGDHPEYDFGSSNYTLTCIVEHRSTPASLQMHMGRYNGAGDGLAIYTDGGVLTLLTPSGSMTHTTVTANTVRHITARRLGTVLNMWDGPVKSADGSTAATTNPVGAWALGTWGTSDSFPGDVNISIAGIWNRALTDDEVQSLVANPWQLFMPQRAIRSVAGTSGPVSHGTTGALTGAGSAIVGASAVISGASSDGWPIGGMVALGRLGASPAGSAVTHDTSGVLTGAGSTAAGSASRFRAFATSGVLTGQGSTIAGAANRFRAMASTGALVGPGSIVVGSANRFRAMASTGALTGPGSIVVGAASRFRAMATTGALVGPGSTVVGAASRTGAPITHGTSGTLTGAGSTIVGSAAHIALHGTSGALVGPGSAIVGAASRTSGVVTHSASGVLVASGALLVGSANHISAYPSPSDVRLGAVYGPGGIYTGTLTGGGTVWLRRR